MNIAEALKRRAALIAWHVGWRKGGRFTGFNPNQHDMDYEFRSDKEVLFWVKPGQAGMPYLHNDRFAQIVFSDIDFKSLDNVTLSDPVKLDAKVIDAQVLERDNRNGTGPLSVNYTGTFTDTVSESTRFAAEIKTGIKATVGTGEGSPVSASVEAYTEFTSTFEKAGGRDKSVSRQISDSFDVPAGEYWKLTGKREVAQMERTATGKVDLSHGIWIGSYQSHHLGRDRWDWHYAWSSFDDFLSVVKGEGPGDLYSEFRNDKLPANMVTELEQPTSAEVVKKYRFDDVTFSRVDVDVIK